MGQHATIHLKTRDEFNGADGKWVPIRGSDDGALATSGEVSQAIPDFTTAAELLAAYGNFSQVSPNDLVQRVTYSNGQVATILSADPHTTGESIVELNVPIEAPGALEIEASMVRAKQMFATLSLYNNATAGADPVPTPIDIVTAYQCSVGSGSAYNATAGTTLTLVLNTALPAIGQPGAVYLSDWINITGLVDNRLNYSNACINWISLDRKTITVNYADETILPSTATTLSPTLGTAKVNFYNNMAGAANGAGFVFTQTSATSAAIVSIFGGGDVQVSGSLITDHRVTVGSTAPIYNAANIDGNYDIRATSRYRIETRPNEVIVTSRPADTTTGYTVPVQGVRTAVKPTYQATLRPRFRVYKPISMSRAVAKIVSASKSGSTTATITTDVAHGLNTGFVVSIRGIKNQTDFPNTALVSITVLNSTQFTVVMGATLPNTTSYGGSVILQNGSIEPVQTGTSAGYTNHIIQSVEWKTTGLDTNSLLVVGNATFVGSLSPGDLINLHGVRNDTNGGDLSVDGVWEVANVATTNLKLVKVYDIFGQLRSPNITSLALTTCGGNVILRTTLRAHDIILEEWSEQRVMIDGAGTTRLDKAVPVSVVNTAPVSGTVTANTTETNLIAPSVLTYTTVATAPAGVSLKATAGTLYGLTITNTSATAIYFKLYNKATAAVVGTDIPVAIIAVPANSYYSDDFTRGLRFSLGISYAVTGLQPVADVTAVSAGSFVFGSYI